MNNLAPILVFTYNRPNHLKNLISSLKKNRLSDKSDLIVFSDNYKNNKDAEYVAEIREYLSTIIGFKDISIIERDFNYGLAQNIISGINEVFMKYNKLIVLEDDLICHEHFLTYMNDALNFYENIDEVMNINGYSYPLEDKNLPQTYFLRQISSWGWGTWKKSWQKINFDNKQIKLHFTKNLIKEFNLNNSYNFWSHFIIHYKNKKKTWAIYWYIALFLNDGLSLFPKNSFISNNGFDGSGENCNIDESYNISFANHTNLEFTNNLQINKYAEESLISFFNNMKKPILSKIKNRLGL